MTMQRAMVCVAWAVITTAMAWAATSAEGADKKETAAELALRGTLVRKSGTAVFVQTDGELQPRRFELKAPGTVLDPKFAAYVKDLAIGTLVELSYGRDSAGRRSANILVLAAPGAFGQMTGVVTDKSDKTDAIEVRDEQGKTERFCPHWRIGGDYKPPGGFDREMLKAIVDLSIGDRVEVHWTKDDHIRVSTMRRFAGIVSTRSGKNLASMWHLGCWPGGRERERLGRDQRRPRGQSALRAAKNSGRQWSIGL